jgi:hypothetical protein
VWALSFIKRESSNGETPPGMVFVCEKEGLTTLRMLHPRHKSKDFVAGMSAAG